MLTALVALAAFAAGYLTRRWHRPVGHRPPPRVQGTEITVAGGAPYRSFTVRQEHPMDPDTMIRTVQALRDKCGPGTP